MKLNDCEYDLETKFVDACSNCRLTRFQRKTPVRIGNFILYITYLYEIRNCLQGFTDGDFLYALSLLPKEEQEVEIVQRSKYQRQLHEQRSVESEFESEFMNTLRTEVSSSVDVNTSVSGDAGFNFFDIVKVGGSAGSSTATHFGANVFNETITKTAIKVSNHYEVSVDVKTEIENQYRSLRKISNPDACRVVTYFFKQLNKKFSLDVVLVGIRFDLVQQLPVLHLETLPYHTITPKFAVAVRRPLVLPNDNPAEAEEPNFAAKATSFKLATNFRTPTVQYAALNEYRSLLYRDIELAKELEADAFLEKLDELKLDEEQKGAIIKEFKAITEREENAAGRLLYHTEYCLRTNSVIAEPKVSHCTICECDDCECKEDKDIKELQLEKLRTEIELLRKQIEQV